MLADRPGADGTARKPAYLIKVREGHLLNTYSTAHVCEQHSWRRVLAAGSDRG